MSVVNIFLMFYLLNCILNCCTSCLFVLFVCVLVFYVLNYFVKFVLSAYAYCFHLTLLMQIQLEHLLSLTLVFNFFGHLEFDLSSAVGFQSRMWVTIRSNS